MDLLRRAGGAWGLALLLVAAPVLSRAQEGAAATDGGSLLASDVDYVVEFWRTEQGLPHNTVNAILQTSDGYLYVGTAAGLARFDGLKFTLIGAETELGNARVTALLEDRSGVLWVGTQGSGVFTLQHGVMNRLSVESGLVDNAVTSLAQDASGTVWIGTQRGLNRWRDAKLDTFVSDQLRAGDGVVSLSVGGSKALWITTRSQVFRMRDGRVEPFRVQNGLQEGDAELPGAYEDKRGNLWTFSETYLLNLSQDKRYNAFSTLDPTSSRAWTICEQEDGTFWIGAGGRGLVRFYNAHFEKVGVREGLDQCDVRALFADHERNLWIGTSGNGLARLRVREWRVFTGTDGLVSSRLTSLAADAGGNYWIGTEDAGLARFNGSTFQSFTMGFPFDAAMNIQSVCVDGRGVLWAGTWGRGLLRIDGNRKWRYDTADGLDDDVVLAVAADAKSGVIWAGTRSGGVHRIRGGEVVRYVADDASVGGPVRCLYPSRFGPLMAGFEHGGLTSWDGQRLVLIPTPPTLSSHAVRSILEDQAGRLWVGTAGGGAFCRLGGVWINLNVSHGLPSDSIGQIVQDSAGNYWFGSDTGVFQVDEREMDSFLNGRSSTVTSLLSARGQGGGELKCSEGFPGAYVSPGGALWFASQGGLLVLDPHNLRVSAPRVRIERVTVNGAVIPPAQMQRGEPLKLGPGIGSLDFDFTAINFIAPEKTQLRYRMEGLDPDWVQSDVARHAHYSTLRPGRYRFRVIAASADGVWNEEGAAVSLVISPPLWQAWWFITICSLGLLGAVWLGVRYVSLRQMRAQLKESEQRRAMERERTRIAQDMHDEIGSKLTRISFLSEIARQDQKGKGASESGETVEAIAGTSRELLQALDEIVWAVNPRNDNLEHLAGYLEQYAREYFQMTPVECIITIPPVLPQVELSAELRHNVFLAFEEALGNALKHADPRHVWIEMNVRGSSFEILVKDDGRGFAAQSLPASSGKDGLLNMRSRLRAVGGECEMDSRPGEGTRVRLRCPLPRRAASASLIKSNS